MHAAKGCIAQVRDAKLGIVLHRVCVASKIADEIIFHSFLCLHETSSQKLFELARIAIKVSEIFESN